MDTKVIKKNPLNQIDEVLFHLEKKDKRMIVAMAPSVRVSLGEGFGCKIGENTEGKIITAFRELGFDDVFDVDFGADLTVVEEANEFVNRYLSGKNLPMFTSCCPAWVKFVETMYPNFINNISTCKSPQQMLAGIVKTFYAEKLGVSPSSLYFVTVMPCIAKKQERLRRGMDAGKCGPDTDAVLTVKEMIEVIKSKNIDFNNLEDGEFDKILGLSSGSGVIFGTTGGVMEASLRTLMDRLQRKDIKEVEYLIVRGLGGIKEGVIKVGQDREIKVAVVSGLNNAKVLLDEIKSGEKYFDFVEVMACPGGCSNGTGMPLYKKSQAESTKIAEMRAKGLYKTDKKKKARKSHKNPAIKKLYKEYLGEIGGERAREILHTKYKRVIIK